MDMISCFTQIWINSLPCILLSHISLPPTEDYAFGFFTFTSLEDLDYPVLLGPVLHHILS